MEEQTILTTLLFVFSFAFFVKMIIFGVLAHEMRPGIAGSPLGRALFRHYLSLSVQSLFLTTLYFYYWGGAPWDESWPFFVRLSLYVLAILNVGWVVLSGIRLLRTYFAIKSETEQLRQEAEELRAWQVLQDAEQRRQKENTPEEHRVMERVEHAADRTVQAAERIEETAEVLGKKGETT